MTRIEEAGKAVVTYKNGASPRHTHLRWVPVGHSSLSVRDRSPFSGGDAQYDDLIAEEGTMDEVRFTYTLLIALTIPCAILLIGYASGRRTMPGANYFILMSFTAIIYNGAYIYEINSNHFPQAIFWFNVVHFVIPLQQYLWLMMSLEYAGVRKRYLKLAKYGTLYHPVLFWIIFYTNIHHLYASSYRFISNGYFPVIVFSKGPLYVVIVASGTMIAMIAMASYIAGYLKAPRTQRFGYLVMITASLIPWFTVYLNATNTSYLGIDYFPVVSIVSGLLFLFGIFQFGIFNTVPIAMETVFRQSKEGILLVDLTDRIIDANHTMLKIYPELEPISAKHTFASFVGRRPELGCVLNGQTGLHYQLTVNGEARSYAAEVTPILAEDGLRIGKILTVNDVTLFAEHQKNLERKAETSEISFLQAQIKPHFLNNALSVIASMVTRDPGEAKKLITDLGEYLTSCSYFDSSSAMELLERELDTVGAYVAIEKARFRERLNYQLVCGHIPNVNIPRLVLQPLVENAIRHGIFKKAGGGRVWLKINRAGRRVCFEVRDDGVGMPEERIWALTMGEDEEQGIGIANIHKRLLKYYGEGLTITSATGQGTSVTFSVPCDIVVDLERRLG
ncbi:MAG: histidine kinase [Peptococcaceae bacterium]|nr:histidine kinase [Peptococcaceae bacterium]